MAKREKRKQCPKCKRFNTAEKFENDLKNTFNECYNCGWIFDHKKELEILKRGTPVRCNGYEGTIIRHYDGPMYEIRLPGGECCTDEFEVIMTTTEKIELFAAIIEAECKRQLFRDKLACSVNLDNAKTSIKPGRKYTKVDVGYSGRYMIETTTERIYGIKAYGVIHRGHYYGTLDKFNSEHGEIIQVA